MDGELITLLIQIVLRLQEALVSPLMLIVLIVIGWQYWRLANQAIAERRWAWRVALRLLFTAMISGTAMGALGSFILVLSGVNVAAAGLIWLWLAALLLMLISPRYLCFAYAGGLVGIINLLTGWPLMDVSQLMVLIATLHLLEALLIYTVGARSALPTITRNRHGVLVGGFTLQQFWPLPLVTVITGNPASVIPVFPSWWPLFYSSDSLLQLIGVLAVLGYAEITTTEYPASRTRISARNLLAYSLILLVLALVSFSIPGFKLLAVVFAPLGHELVIYLGLRREEKGFMLWSPSAQGVRVLWAVPGSPAQRAGFRSGDIIISVGSESVKYPEDLHQALIGNNQDLAVLVERAGNEMVLMLRKSGKYPAGLLILPESQTDTGEPNIPRTWFHRLLPSGLK